MNMKIFVLNGKKVHLCNMLKCDINPSTGKTIP